MTIPGVPVTDLLSPFYFSPAGYNKNTNILIITLSGEAWNQPCVAPF